MEIQIDVNPKHSWSFELNKINNIGVRTNFSIDVHNIGVGTISDSNNPLGGNIDECLRNNKKDESNEANFSLHDTPIDCLFSIC